MSIEMHKIEVDGLVVNIVRKNIKNLHLAVYPPNGRIRVAAPLRLDDEAVRMAVISRLGWIKRQQTKFKEQERQTAREYVSGESHYFQGGRYRLNVILRDTASQVAIRNKQFIDLYVRPASTTEHRQRAMAAWYRAYLKETIPGLIIQWEKILGVTVAEWSIKQMKTRWGTCKIETGHIWVNLELAKKSPRCLEYIVVHEMVHLLERLHTDRFRSLMNQFLPQWQLIRDELNREPLAHEDWEY
jgi:predicted metal-dependent hydrolase